MNFRLYLGVAGLLMLHSGASHAADEPPVSQYGPGELAPAEFELDERTRAGGRLTPFFSKYSPDLSFESEGTVRCQFHTQADGGHMPGTTGPIELICPTTLSAGQTFTAYERRREIGRGVVLARE